MAKQTIIVMSDSHGDRSIVEAIKDKIPRSGRWDLSQWGF